MYRCNSGWGGGCLQRVFYKSMTAQLTLKLKLHAHVFTVIAASWKVIGNCSEVRQRTIRKTITTIRNATLDYM